MGLDQYAYKIINYIPESSIGFEHDFHKKTYEELYYWRKNYNLHTWMEELYVSKGGTDEFNCKVLLLTMDDIKNLEQWLNENEDEDISTARISYRNALLNLQATAQRLHTKATLDDIPFYQNEAEKYMKESGKKLYKLGTIGGSIRKRNKSRNKVYSAHKKSKRRRVKSTRRRHKKSTMHHRSKY